MKNLQTLIAAGFTHGAANNTGVDSTVSSLEWALANLPNGSSTARTYAEEAGKSLEARLMVSYVIQSLAYLNNSRNVALAHEAYKKAAVLNQLSQSSGNTYVEIMNGALLELAEWLRQAGVAV